MDTPETTNGQTPHHARRDAIAQRAFALYEQRGGADGNDIEDWLEAEREFIDPEPQVDERPIELQADQVR